MRARTFVSNDTVDIENRIHTIRGMRVILDRDLAEIYGVETKQLKRAVSRNKHRFPDDFAFVLAPEEVTNLRCQNGTSSSGWGGSRYPPYVFTEHGAIMAANVLHSRKAEEMSVFVVRAFVKMREELLTKCELEKRLDQIEKILLVHDQAVVALIGRAGEASRAT